jgi:hypothetical protein
MSNVEVFFYSSGGFMLAYFLTVLFSLSQVQRANTNEFEGGVSVRTPLLNRK